MSIFLTFLPWIAQGFLTSFSLPLALGVSLSLSVLSLGRSRHILEWTTFLFFLLSFFLSFFFQDQFFYHAVSLLSTLTLSLIAWGSLALEKPFTLPYAKKRAPKEHWESPIFIKINSLMTFFFGIIFSLEVCVKVARLLYPDLLPYTYIFYLFSICIVIFVAKFPGWYKARALKSATDGDGK